ncbi:ComEC/Rec2 family competence protein [Nocardia sp. NPDC048505]|uniref:ComEC/Rec2 family competence protein n=1 Tax=Nocardia sp. NPDC048505 TaxID=3155756 RepID=UPI00340F05F9
MASCGPPIGRAAHGGVSQGRTGESGSTRTSSVGGRMSVRDGGDTVQDADGASGREKERCGGGDVEVTLPSQHAQAQALDARLLPAAVCCWGATIAALGMGWVGGVLLAGGLVVVALGLWGLLVWAVMHRRERWRAGVVVALAAVLLGAGFAGAAGWRAERVEAHPLRDVVGRSVLVVMVPADDPKALRVNDFGGEQRWMVRGRLTEFQLAGRTVRAGGAVVVLGTGAEWGRVVPGQALRFRARVQMPARRDLTVVSLRAMAMPERVGALPWWQRAAVEVRGDLAGAAERALSADAAGLLPALVVGDVSRLPDSVRADFEVAGLQHLCVVSGANFTILLSVVLFVVRMLTLGPRVAALLAAGALVMFVVIARPDPSVLRAAAMGAITLLALVTGRRKQALPALCAAVIGLLALWPELAVQAGFALSVVATGGLILLAPSWADWLRARGWWRLPAEILAVSAGAFVVTVPIMIALTGRISVLAVLANVLVAPVIAPITVLGAVSAVLACLWPPLAEPVLHCAAPPLWWLLSVAERAAALPGATISVPGGTIGGVIAALLIAVTVWALRSGAFRRCTAAGLVGAAAVLLPVRIWHPGWPPGDWVIAACDVGQGDGLALSLGNRSAVVIDVGPDPHPIRACLDRLRIKRIELLVLTHPHADHIGGLAGAIHGRTVGAIAVGPYELSGPPDDPRCASETAIPASSRGCARANAAEHDPRQTDTEKHRTESAAAVPPRRGPVTTPAQIATLARQSSIPVVELSAGRTLPFTTVRLEVLAPAPTTQAPDLDPDHANDRSVVLAATTSAGRILLTGDIEAEAQHRLITSGINLRTDILKVPHHGSRTTTREFLTATRPRLALISAGNHNTFGHPHPAILAELTALGTTIARTDQHGDIIVAAKPTLRTVTTRHPKPTE